MAQPSRCRSDSSVAARWRGLVAPHWPRPWGLDASPIEQLLVDDELRRASCSPVGRGCSLSHARISRRNS
ncbi:MAG: hypothetical protein EBU98_05375 [Actinobacteria bacterium]|nr:hypothetical protein [Actinomycetota bacterium]